MKEDERMRPDFTAASPPVLTRAMLEEELERRRLHGQTALLALAGSLLEGCFLLAAFLLWRDCPVLATACAAGTAGSLTGGGILAVICTARGGEWTC